MATSRIRKQVMQEDVPQEWSDVSIGYELWIKTRIMVPFLAAFVATSYLLPLSPWWFLAIIAVMVIYGYKISFILHDCSHNAILRGKGPNLWLGRVLGWFVEVNYKARVFGWNS